MRHEAGDGDFDIEQLRVRAAEALAGTTGRSTPNLDALLTECAAVALRLRAQRVRIEREIEQVREVAAGVRALRDGIGDEAIAS